jgi:hypothetical protein
VEDEGSREETDRRRKNHESPYSRKRRTLVLRGRKRKKISGDGFIFTYLFFVSEFVPVKQKSPIQHSHPTRHDHL